MKKLMRSSNNDGKSANRSGKPKTPLVEEPFKRRINNLIRTLGSSNSENRAEAANTLMAIEHEGLLPALIEALNDENELVQGAVTIILGILKDSSTTPALCKALENTDSLTIKRDILWTLGEIRDISSVPALVEAFTSTNPKVSEAASNALVKIGREVVPLVAKELKSRDWSVQVCAAEVLERIGDESAIPALLEAVRDKNEMVAVSALGAVEEIKRKNKT
ncbi:HEAT repeat domain-containing protein, partial [Candidatus Micrarchaeota archaeon]|nr:HEAT repeat domain-containing protein [Candidatus Micrarchaeota archaeon]